MIQHAWDPRTNFSTTWCGEDLSVEIGAETDLPVCATCHRRAMKYRADMQRETQALLKALELRAEELGVVWDRNRELEAYRLQYEYDLNHPFEESDYEQ